MFQTIPESARQPLADLDGLAPGLSARLQQGPLIRHAVLTVITDKLLNGLVVDGRLEGDDHADEFLAWTLLVDSPEEILADHFGDAPAGWFGALAALGDEQMTAAGYYFLRTLFTDPVHAGTAEALAGVESISEETLRIVQALDARWLNSQILRRINSVEDAETFNFSADFVLGICAVSEAQIMAAITNLKPGETLDEMFAQFLREADDLDFDLSVGEPKDIERLAVITTDSGDDERPERSAVFLIRGSGDDVR